MDGVKIDRELEILFDKENSVHVALKCIKLYSDLVQELEIMGSINAHVDSFLVYQQRVQFVLKYYPILYSLDVGERAIKLMLEQCRGTWGGKEVPLSHRVFLLQSILIILQDRKIRMDKRLQIKSEVEKIKANESVSIVVRQLTVIQKLNIQQDDAIEDKAKSEDLVPVEQAAKHVTEKMVADARTNKNVAMDDQTDVMVQGKTEHAHQKVQDKTQQVEKTTDESRGPKSKMVKESEVATNDNNDEHHESDREPSPKTNSNSNRLNMPREKVRSRILELSRLPSNFTVRDVQKLMEPIEHLRQNMVRILSFQGKFRAFATFSQKENAIKAHAMIAEKYRNSKSFYVKYATGVCSSALEVYVLSDPITLDHMKSILAKKQVHPDKICSMNERDETSSNLSSGFLLYFGDSNIAKSQSFQLGLRTEISGVQLESNYHHEKSFELLPPIFSRGQTSMNSNENECTENKNISNPSKNDRITNINDSLKNSKEPAINSCSGVLTPSKTNSNSDERSNMNMKGRNEHTATPEDAKYSVQADETLDKAQNFGDPNDGQQSNINSRRDNWSESSKDAGWGDAPCTTGRNDGAQDNAWTNNQFSKSNPSSDFDSRDRFPQEGGSFQRYDSSNRDSRAPRQSSNRSAGNFRGSRNEHPSSRYDDYRRNDSRDYAKSDRMDTAPRRSKYYNENERNSRPHDRRNVESHRGNSRGDARTYDHSRIGNNGPSRDEFNNPALPPVDDRRNTFHHRNSSDSTLNFTKSHGSKSHYNDGRSDPSQQRDFAQRGRDDTSRNMNSRYNDKANYGHRGRNNFRGRSSTSHYGPGRNDDHHDYRGGNSRMNYHNEPQQRDRQYSSTSPVVHSRNYNKSPEGSVGSKNNHSYAGDNVATKRSLDDVRENSLNVPSKRAREESDENDNQPSVKSFAVSTIIQPAVPHGILDAEDYPSELMVDYEEDD